MITLIASGVRLVSSMERRSHSARAAEARNAAKARMESAARSRASAIPGRHASPEELEELAHMERQLRASGWREGADTATTAELVQQVLTLREGEAAGDSQAVDVAIEEMRRTTLLHSQSAELRVAALAFGPVTYVGERLLEQARIRLYDPDPRVRVAAARLLGERAPPVSIGALSLSTAIETERDPDVRDAFRRADARVWERVRAMWEERRAARR